MGVRHCVVAALLVAGPAAAQEPVPFPGEADGQALESAAADQEGSGEFSWRWRVQGWPASLRQVRVYQRLTWQPSARQQLFVLLEKDPAEQRLTDFAAFYARWQSAARPVELVAGDLRPGFGQGLVFGRSAAGRSLSVPQARRDSKALGYRSSDENGAVRGLAARIGGERLQVAFLAGRARRDARVDQSGQVVSLPQTGLHVTARELEGHGRLAVRVAGARVRGCIGRAEAGVTVQGLNFDHRLDLRRPGRAAQAFCGRSQRLAGVDARVDLTAAQCFAEAAQDRGGHRALLAGAHLRAGRAHLGGLLHYYGPGFHSFLGGASSPADLQNEQGWSLVAESARSRGHGQLFVERARQLQPRAPVEQVWGMRVDAPLAGALRGELCWQQETRVGRSGARSWSEPGRRARLELEHRLGPSGRLGGRAEARVVEDRNGQTQVGRLGSLLGQATARGCRLTGQLSRFHTTAYAARLYEYEYELPGAASVRALSGNGWRGYGVLEGSWRKLTLSARYRWQHVRGKAAQHRFGMQADLGGS